MIVGGEGDWGVFEWKGWSREHRIDGVWLKWLTCCSDVLLKIVHTEAEFSSCVPKRQLGVTVTFTP